MLQRRGRFLTRIAIVVLLVTASSTFLISDAYAESNAELDRRTDFSAVPASSVPPDPPRNLTLIPGSDHVNVFWEPPESDGGSPIVSYDVLRGTLDVYEGGYGISLTLLVTVGPLVLEYRDTQVEFGDVFYYAVRARNDVDHGYTTETKWARVGGSVPAAPTNLTAIASSFEVELTWIGPADAGGTGVSEYRIYRGNTSGDETHLFTVRVESPIHLEPGWPARFTDVGLMNGQRYYYKVSAVNSLGEGPMSDSESARPNFAPIAYVWTGESHNGLLSVTLRWNPPAENESEVISYRIYYQDYWISEAVWGILAEVGNQTFAFNDTVSECLGRLYRVAAVYSGGDEVFSEITDRYWPMCEGSNLLFVSEIVTISLFILGLIVVPLLIVLRKRR
jgi:hypothetical protein